MGKKKDFDILGIVLGVVIGAVIGFFIGRQLNTTEDIPVITEPINEQGNIYLLQVNRFDNADGAINYQTMIKNKGLDCVIVSDNGIYYLYGGIASTKEKLNDKALSFEAKGFTVNIRKEYILDLANTVIDDDYSFNFWLEGINNLLNSLNNEPIIISEKYYIEPVDLEFFSSLSILQTIQNEDLKNKVRLQTYKMLVEKLK